MSQSLAPILDESFSLVKESLQIVGRMPKALKFTLGTKISEKTLQISLYHKLGKLPVPELAHEYF